MDNRLINKILIRTLHEHGIIIDNIDESTSVPIFYISVPEYSDIKNVDGGDVANKYLAKKFKETLSMRSEKNVIVKMKIRKGEIWTKEKAKNANIVFDNMYI